MISEPCKTPVDSGKMSPEPHMSPVEPCKMPTEAWNGLDRKEPFVTRQTVVLLSVIAILAMALFPVIVIRLAYMTHVVDGLRNNSEDLGPLFHNSSSQARSTNSSSGSTLDGGEFNISLNTSKLDTSVTASSTVATTVTVLSNGPPASAAPILLRKSPVAQSGVSSEVPVTESDKSLVARHAPATGHSSRQLSNGLLMMRLRASTE